MAGDDDWDEDDGKWTKRSKDADAQDQDSTRYFELPSGEVVEGEPPDDVPAEPVEPPEEDEDDEDEGLGLFGGEDDEPEEEPPEDEEEPPEDEEEDRKAPLIVGALVVILLIGLIALVALAVLNVTDPLGLGDALGTGSSGDGTPGATDGNGNGGSGDGGGNETPTMFSYPVNWNTFNNSVSESSEEEVNEGETVWANVTIARANITDATLQFEWDDSGDATGDLGTGSNNDTFKVTLTAPDGTEDSVEQEGAGGGQGNIEITLDLASVPDGTTVEAQNESAAQQQVQTEFPTDNTTAGTWEVKIELVSADPCVTTGGTADPDDGPDCSNSWDYTLDYSWYEAELGEGTEVES